MKQTHEPSRQQVTDTRVIALAGNPNVGKSTIFNALTGMRQHTGNWPGKTVTQAIGKCRSKQNDLRVVDIPGTYSLASHSVEEEVARNFICFGEPDAVVVVCDATCLERNLHLALQILESGARVVMCVNLLDEAERKGISVDLSLLKKRLGVPVVGVIAKKKRTLTALTDAIDTVLEQPLANQAPPIPYPAPIEEAIDTVERALDPADLGRLDSRWLAIRLLDESDGFQKDLADYLGDSVLSCLNLQTALSDARSVLASHAIDRESLQDLITASIVTHAETLMRGVVTHQKTRYENRDRKLDRILTGRVSAYPVMLLLLALIFFITIKLSNLPSAALSSFLFGALERLSRLLVSLHAPPWLIGFLVDGVLRVLAWVISVMLPPMAIFFPLFTLLEDAGYLPRVAYNLDRPFQCCHACGKQALTMCMGLGCNAVGVVGARIIDSPRERLLAILTNSMVPCNGRFPALVTLITLFFIGSSAGIQASIGASLILTALILLSIFSTLLFTRFLSSTVLSGTPSSFTLEMPPFRKPRIAEVLVRSVLDRTLFVLARAAAVAAPAGAVIWILANISIGDLPILLHVSRFLDPFARFFGLDGAILLAFILGFPANEIVLPLTVMVYRAGGVLTELGGMSELGELLIQNGWTPVTALCTLVFFLFHWPCSTTLLTVKRETGSLRWTALAALLPTLWGLLLCALIANTARCFFGY